ncbi:MAG: hypothetical protein DHS20C11_15780 [Lysobacteraceae bacterium]|nr:MAG: hypothetical protein DHS20C11_15780 [Xanthomonadaceae bacterium]
MNTNTLTTNPSSTWLIKATGVPFAILAYMLGSAVLGWMITLCLGITQHPGILVSIENIAGAISLNLFLLGLWGYLHSAMADPKVKRWLQHWVPAWLMRSIYVFVAAITLGLTLMAWQPLPLTMWHVETPLLRALIFSGSVLGWSLMFAATFAIDHFDLFGLRQVWKRATARAYEPAPFVLNWVYRLCRHPLMLGMLIGMWCVPTMTLGTITFAIGCTAYVLVGIQHEERSLADELGPAYDVYQQTTPQLIPNIKRWFMPNRR